MQKLNVCLIDDDSIQIFLMKKFLEKSGCVHTIVSFENGKQAYDYFNSDQSETIHLIFLDINMPVWDGWEFLKEFSKLKVYKKTLIYLLTSSQSPFDREQASKYKLDQYYLSKPISFESVQKIVTSYFYNS